MTLVNTDTGEIVARSLAENEQVIAAGLQTFVEVGEALMEIRELRQYREVGFSDFDAYCRERWQMSRTQSDRLISASETVGHLAPIGATPKNEAQVRPLTRLPSPEAKRDAWKQATDKAKSEGRDAPVARDVEDIVRKVVEEETSKKARKDEDRQALDNLAATAGLPARGTPEAKEADRRLDVIATALGWIRDFERRDMRPPAEVIALAEDTDRDVLRRAAKAHAWLSDLLAETERKFG